MKKYLVEYLAEHFWNFVMAENKKFTDVMEADEVLAKRVFGLRAGVSEAEVKDKEAEKIKSRNRWAKTRTIHCLRRPS